MPDPSARHLRVALLTNNLSPHVLPLCEHISRGVGAFCAFVSAEEDRSHRFPKAEASFPVRLQRSINSFRVPRRAYGHWQRSELHVPYDTYQQLCRYQPDLILSLQFGLRTALAVLYRQRHPGVKLVLWAALSGHTEERRSRARRALRRWILRRSDGAFVNGAGGEEYLRTLGFKEGMFRIPYTIDETVFRSESYRPQEGRLRLVYAGNLVPQKGLRAFCEALDAWSVEHPEVQVDWKLVGNGPEGEALRSSVHARNLTLTTCPAVEQRRLAEFYRGADMLVFPSLGDEWGVVVNEAMIAGLPVLGSIYSQAVTELVEEGVSGWRFDPQNPASIRASLDRAFGCSTEALQAMSRSAQRKVAEIAPAIVAARALAALAQVAAGRGQD